MFLFCELIIIFFFYLLDPRISPQGVYSTDITSNTAVIGWKEIPRKDAHGDLLGYIVKVQNRNTWRYEKEINTSDTSVILTDLSRGSYYRVEIRGYTSVGSGPSAYHDFNTLCKIPACHCDCKIYIVCRKLLCKSS